MASPASWQMLNPFLPTQKNVTVSVKKRHKGMVGWQAGTEAGRGEERKWTYENTQVEMDPW